MSGNIRILGIRLESDLIATVFHSLFFKTGFAKLWSQILYGVEFLHRFIRERKRTKVFFGSKSGQILNLTYVQTSNRISFISNLDSK